MGSPGGASVNKISAAPKSPVRITSTPDKYASRPLSLTRRASQNPAAIVT